MFILLFKKRCKHDSSMTVNRGSSLAKKSLLFDVHNCIIELILLFWAGMLALGMESRRRCSFINSRLEIDAVVFCVDFLRKKLGFFVTEFDI